MARKRFTILSIILAPFFVIVGISVFALIVYCLLIYTPTTDTGVFLENPNQDGYKKYPVEPKHHPRVNIYINPNSPDEQLRLFVMTGLERPIKITRHSPTVSSYEYAVLDTKPAIIGINPGPAYGTAESKAKFKQYRFNPMAVTIELKGTVHKSMGYVFARLDDYAEAPGKYPMSRTPGSFTNDYPQDGFLIFFDLSYRELVGGKLHIGGVEGPHGPVSIPPTRIVGEKPRDIAAPDRDIVGMAPHTGFSHGH